MENNNDDLHWLWEEHQSTLLSALNTFLENVFMFMFIDLTVEAEEQFIAHIALQDDKSPHHLSQHIVPPQELKFDVLKTMIDYMYKGELIIREEEFASFLESAKKFKLRVYQQVPYQLR